MSFLKKLLGTKKNEKDAPVSATPAAQQQSAKAKAAADEKRKLMEQAYAKASTPTPTTPAPAVTPAPEKPAAPQPQPTSPQSAPAVVQTQQSELNANSGDKTPVSAPVTIPQVKQAEPEVNNSAPKQNNEGASSSPTAESPSASSPLSSSPTSTTPNKKKQTFAKNNFVQFKEKLRDAKTKFIFRKPNIDAAMREMQSRIKIIMDICKEIDMTEVLKSQKFYIARDEAFKNAGQKVGVQIWHIVRMIPVPVPENEYGTFLGGDCYIVLKTNEAANEDERIHRIHMWMGRDANMVRCFL